MKGSKSEAYMSLTSGLESESGSNTLSCTMVTIGHTMTNHSSHANTNPKLTCVQINMMRKGKISKYWILLNSESTIEIIKDGSLLRNI